MAGFVVASGLMLALALFCWFFLRAQKHPLAALIAAELFVLAACTQFLAAAQQLNILPEAQVFVIFVSVLSVSEAVLFMTFWALEKRD